MATATYAPLSLDKIDTLDESTLGIVEFAMVLWNDKNNLSKVEFKNLVRSLGWGRSIVNEYLKIAEAFQDIEIGKLSRIEPRTLFKITSSKKFISVVDGIKNSIVHVTQQLVENLIEACRTPRVPKLEEPNSIWRAEKDGSRSCVIPPIKEDDQFTGMAIQRGMDVEGISAQSFIREAVALHEAWLCGALALKDELPLHLESILGDKLHYPEPEMPIYDDEPVDEDEPIEVAEDIEIVEIEVVEDIEVVGIVETVEAAEESQEAETVETVKAVTETETPPILSIWYETGITPAPDKQISHEQVAALLTQCQTWSEVAEITSDIDSTTRVNNPTL